MIDLSDKEKLMYRIMGAVAAAEVPLVFKGAMVTKLLLHEHNFNAFSRETQDIDASWNGNLRPTMVELTAMLNKVLAQFSMRAVVKREYGEKKSAGFNVVYESSGELVVAVDIDMRPEEDGKIYQYGDASFYGASVDHILSDKIYVFSTELAYRRVKDAVDIYALSHCVKIELQSILTIWRASGRTPGMFDAIHTRQADLEHAYLKLRRIEPKPDFSVVINRLQSFLEPFVHITAQNLVWNNSKLCWQRPPQPSILRDLHEYNEAIKLQKSRDVQSKAKSKNKDGLNI